jgi:putative membrane protein
MRNFASVIVGTGALALLLGACGRGQERPAPQPRTVSRAPVRAPAVAPISAASYLSEAAAIDLFEIRSAELALRRSSSARVREFASMMIPAHKGTASQLSLAGRRLNLLPSAVLPAGYGAMLGQLQSAADFDRLYRSQQLAVHERALSLHRRYAARGTSPTLRPVASAMIPVTERHLRLLRYL